jgi:hypothetical protein
MDVKMVQWFDDHWYKIELEDDSEEYLPSVTTKLQAEPKPFLAKWRGDIGNREADIRSREATDKGSRIHRGCEVYATGGAVVYNPQRSPNYSPEELSDIRSSTASGVVEIIRDQDEMLQVWRFQQWMSLVRPTILGIEQTVYSEEMRAAGTLDYAFQINEGTYKINGSKPLALEGGIYIADVKSGGLYESAYYQLAAYRRMYEMLNDCEVQGCFVLHLNAKTRSGIPGMATVLRKEEYEDDLDTYNRIAAVWEATNRNAHPKVFELPTLLMKEENNENADG